MKSLSYKSLSPKRRITSRLFPSLVYPPASAIASQQSKVEVRPDAAMEAHALHMSPETADTLKISKTLCAALCTFPDVPESMKRLYSHYDVFKNEKTKPGLLMRQQLENGLKESLKSKLYVLKSNSRNGVEMEQ
jgi:hypothetical protein